MAGAARAGAPLGGAHAAPIRAPGCRARRPPHQLRRARPAGRLTRAAADRPRRAARERRLFHSLFATDDRTEGMQAFLEKRPGAVQRPLTSRLDHVAGVGAQPATCRL